MNLSSKQLSGPKIKAFLQLFPFLLQTYGSQSFEVREAIRRINGASDLGIWCHEDDKINLIEKKSRESKGAVSLNLQNACHCFSGRTESAIVNQETGQEIRLLDWIGPMTYRITTNANEFYKNIIA